MQKLRVLVVDDSILFCELLVRAINKDPGLEVVAVAGDAYEARDRIVEFRPDVMTLDVELPKMSGIEFIRRLLPQYYIPIVCVSALNGNVFDALEAGAVDFVNKPSGMTAQAVEDFVLRELNTKIKIASMAKPRVMQESQRHTALAASASGNDRVIAIGASTGGTEAIFDVIKNFGQNIPGVVVVQHMPPVFTAMYAERLNRQCLVTVKEAKDGDYVRRGQVLIAPGDKHMRLVKTGGVYRVECKEGEKVSGHCPSVDVLFQSVAEAAGDKAIGVILTGMGADGAKGLLSMRKAGAQTIGQDEESCVVYGMPKVAYDNGAVRYQVSLTQVADKVHALLNQHKST